LKALKPFLTLNDSLKKEKLEWIFGIPIPVMKKTFLEKPRYGIETIIHIGDETTSFNSPILHGASDDALIT